MSDLHELSAAEQLSGLRAGDFSSQELVRHYADRIARLDGELNAFVTVSVELALQEAAAADARLAEGDEAPLLGLPVAMKDLFATAGVRTTLGSPALPDVVPASDSWAVGLMREAGAVLLGKTSTSELGATCFTQHSLSGRPTVTPYDLSRYASGSSGGAAAAVAAGLLPVGHGSDSAGSIRTPSATCHLVGVKPSRGLVSSAPSGPFLAAGTEGPIARSVEDAALLLDVLAQPAPGDLYGWRPPHPFRSALREGTRRLSVGVWTDSGIEGVATHPEAERAVERYAALLAEHGHAVRRIDLPAAYDDEVRRAFAVWFASSVTAVVRTALPRDGIDQLRPYTRHLVQTGTRLSAVDVVTAHSVLARFAGAFLEASSSVDVCLTPVTNGPPVPVGHFEGAGVDGIADLMLAWSAHTPWANLTGQPAVSLPSHLDDAGLPHAVQLVGRPRADAELLALAAELERAGAWEPRHPASWSQ